MQQSQIHVPIIHVMQSNSFRIEVLANAFHHHCNRCKPRPSINKPRTKEPNWVIPFLNDKHSNQLLDSVQDKIPSKLTSILMHFNHFLRGQLIQMTALRTNHYRDIPQTNILFLDFPVVNLLAHHAPQTPRVGARTDSAFAWK